ncbi:MAG TPA: HNH endonuclease signature motif containing protein [Acidimicrobiales bacterium]|nr:HNH endonuclease signature motif containing protein [Acidimicrobiales bacterium]
MVIQTPNMASPPVASTILAQKRWTPPNLRRPEKRSPHWRKARKAHLKLQPECQACGTTDDLQVHHIKPFHLHPELELVQMNLVTLCEKRGRDCHFSFGHFHNWQAMNPNVIADVQHYRSESEEAHRALVGGPEQTRGA